MDFPAAAATTAVRRALAEDATVEDVTTKWSVPQQLRAEAEIIARQDGVIAGLPVMASVFTEVDAELKVQELVSDGARVHRNDVVAKVSGSARSLITGERTALNFLQRLSGIASLTARYVDAVSDLPMQILDTRKTAPGLRHLDKYAVAVGGGSNHRLDLSAMVLLKENHIAAAGGVTAAVAAVRKGMAEDGKDLLIDVEVQSLSEAEEALRSGVSWIMLDNMSLPEMK